MYSFESRIRYSETDSQGYLTLSALLNYFQDCTTFHSEDIGLGLDYMAEQKMAWVLNSWQIVVERYPKICETVTIGTKPYEFKSFMGSRNFVMLDGEGAYLAKANTLWSLLNLETGKPCLPTKEMLEGYVLEEKIPMDYASRKIPIPEGGEHFQPIEVKEHHLDTNQHVNNGQYVAIAGRFLPLDFKISQMRAEYKKQAFLGDLLYPYVVKQENMYTISLQDQEGKVYASVEFLSAEF